MFIIMFIILQQATLTAPRKISWKLCLNECCAKIMLIIYTSAGRVQREREHVSLCGWGPCKWASRMCFGLPRINFLRPERFERPFCQNAKNNFIERKCECRTSLERVNRKGAKSRELDSSGAIAVVLHN